MGIISCCMKIAPIAVLLAGATLFMSWTCSKPAFKRTSRPARVLRYECPDTVATNISFDITVAARVANCERLTIAANAGRYAPDTTWFRVLAERENRGRSCDTSLPEVIGTMKWRYKSQGKQFLILEAENGQLMDSVYVK